MKTSVCRPPVTGSKSDLRHNNRPFGNSLFESPCRTVDKREAGFNTDRCFVAAAHRIFEFSAEWTRSLATVPVLWAGMCHRLCTPGFGDILWFFCTTGSKAVRLIKWGIHTSPLLTSVRHFLFTQTNSGSDDTIPPSSPADGGMVQMCRCKHAGNQGRTCSDLLSKKRTRNRRALFLRDPCSQPRSGPSPKTNIEGKCQWALSSKRRNRQESCSCGAFFCAMPLILINRAGERIPLKAEGFYLRSEGLQPKRPASKDRDVL